MRKLNRSIILSGLVLAMFTGCGRSASPETGPITGDSDATLVVENRAPLDMRIYAVYSGQRIRLGSVTAVQTERLEIPSTIVGPGRDLVFQADPLAGQSVASSFNIFVAPGDVVTITIPPTVR